MQTTACIFENSAFEYFKQNQCLHDNTMGEKKQTTAVTHQKAQS